MLLAGLVFGVDQGAPGPGQLRLPHQGGVGDGRMALEVAVGAAETGLAEAALQPRGLAVGAGGAQVERSGEGLGGDEVGIGLGRSCRQEQGQDHAEREA